jgi:hypothetical protein
MSGLTDSYSRRIVARGGEGEKYGAKISMSLSRSLQGSSRSAVKAFATAR